MLARSLFLALVLVAQPLFAQSLPPYANQRGFSFGLDPLAYGELTSEYVTDSRTVGGIGVSLRFGWGFTEQWALVLDVTASDLKVADTAEYFLSTGDILVRWTPFAREAALGTWAPFLHAGIGLRDVTAEGVSPTGTRIYSLYGEVLTVGGGAELYVTPALALFAAAYWSTGDFNDERIGNVTTHSRGVSGLSFRVSTGLTFHRARRRIDGVSP